MGMDLKTIRRRELYSFLLSHADQWVPLEVIASRMRSLYPAFREANFHNSSARRHITADIQAINESHDFEKLVVHGSLGVKIATKEEAERYLHCAYCEIFKKLDRVRTLEKKAGMDGQVVLSADGKKGAISAFAERRL